MTLPRRRFLLGVAALPASSVLAGRPLPGIVATVHNGYELHTALQTAGAGSSIVLAPGNFGDIGQFILASSNVSIRVQVPQRTVLRSPVVVQGNLVDLEGLAFQEGIVLVGDGLTITGSVFAGSPLEIRGVGTEVAGCEFHSYKSRAISINGTAQNPYIHHNYIHDCMSGANSAVRVGQSTRDSNRRISARIDSNRFERCRPGSSETISVKSSGNVISGNTFTDCNNVVNRHGEDNLYQGNTLERCYGLLIHDGNNRVVGNRLVTPTRFRGISIMGGNCPWNATIQGSHPQAYNTFLAGNSGAMIIGAQYSGDNLPAVNTIVDSHQGSIALKAHVGTVLPPGTVPGGQNIRQQKKNRKKGAEPPAPTEPAPPEPAPV